MTSLRVLEPVLDPTGARLGERTKRQPVRLSHDMSPSSANARIRPRASTTQAHRPRPAVEPTPGHYRVLRDGRPLRKHNGMPFMLPFSPGTTRWRRAAIVDLRKLGIDVSRASTGEGVVLVA